MQGVHKIFCPKKEFLTLREKQTETERGRGKEKEKTENH